MSFEKFDDNCKGCEPILINPKTGLAYSDNSPEMIEVMKVWKTTTREERAAFHRVTCLNSRATSDLFLCVDLNTRISAALQRVTNVYGRGN